MQEREFGHEAAAPKELHQKLATISRKTGALHKDSPSESREIIQMPCVCYQTISQNYAGSLQGWQHFTNTVEERGFGRDTTAPEEYNKRCQKLTITRRRTGALHEDSPSGREKNCLDGKNTTSRT
jgi:hypothetical protein